MSGIKITVQKEHSGSWRYYAGGMFNISSGGQINVSRSLRLVKLLRLFLQKLVGVMLIFINILNM